MQEKLSFQDARKFLYNINKHQLSKLLKQYNLIGEINGRYTLYNYLEIQQIKLIMDKRYELNLSNKLATSQVKKLGLRKHELEKLSIISAEPIDRIQEFQGALFLYDKNEVLQLIFEKKEKERLLNGEQVKKELGISHHIQFHEVLNHFNLKAISFKFIGGLFYEPSEVNEIKKIIVEQYKFNVETRFKFKDILGIGGNNSDIHTFTPIKIKCFERVGKFRGVECLYSKEEVILRINSKNSGTETYVTSEVAELLNLSIQKVPHYLKKLGMQSEIFPGNLNNRWKKTEIDKIIERKNELFSFYQNNFLTIREVENHLDINYLKLQRLFRNLNIPIEYHDIPDILKVDKYSKVRVLLAKKDISSLVDIYIKNAKISLSQTKNLKRNLVKLIENIKKSYTEENSLYLNILKENEKSFAEFSIYLKLSSVNDLLLELNNCIEIEGYESKLLISESDLLKSYNISYSCFKKLLQSKKSGPPSLKYKNLLYYSSEDVKRFFGSRIKQQQELLKEYFLGKQAISLGVFSGFLSKVSKINIPSDLRFGVFRKNFLLYKKTECTDMLETKRMKDICNKYRKHPKITTLPADVFKLMLDDLDKNFNSYHFNSNLEKTKKLWFNFVIKKLNYCDGNDGVVWKNINKFINLTKIICEVVIEKDITEWSSNEINTKLLNYSTHVTYLLTLYIFLIDLSNSNNARFKKEHLINVYKIMNSNKKNRNIKHYSIEEFVKLIDYVKDIKLHKKEFFYDLHQPLSGNLKYREYESVWLYILIHLNNAWRSTDIIEKIPRITLPSNISTLEQYEKYEITPTEAKSIIWELAAKVIKVQHGKNNKKAYYFCSEELEIPLANALVFQL